jgi:hypothetical protein
MRTKTLQALAVGWEKFANLHLALRLPIIVIAWPILLGLYVFSRSKNEIVNFTVFFSLIFFFQIPWITSIAERADLNRSSISTIGEESKSKDSTKVETDEKEEFAEKYATGFIDVDVLLSKKLVSLDDVIKSRFARSVFKTLVPKLTFHGVGPGELAFSVLSPLITHSGRKVGAGDLIINNKAIELKATVKCGGRWGNSRKADLNMKGIRDVLIQACQQANITIPPRVGINFWINIIRPALQDQPKLLDHVTKVMADGLFSHVDNTKYQTALKFGDANTIKDTVLKTGYENYKKYSNFDGILLLDVRRNGTAQYFETYEDMCGHIKSSTIYLLSCDEYDCMPQIVISPELI